jgi:hypothetical protein
LADFEAWEKNSKKDPLFVFKVNWQRASRLRDVVENAISSVRNIPKRFGETEIRTAFTIAEDGLRENLIKRFGMIKTKNKFSDLILSAVIEKMNEITNAFSRVAEESFGQAINIDNLNKSFSDFIKESFNEMLEQDFRRLAGEVLIRRKITTDDLIEMIRNGRR